MERIQIVYRSSRIQVVKIYFKNNMIEHLKIDRTRKRTQIENVDFSTTTFLLKPFNKL